MEKPIKTFTPMLAHKRAKKIDFTEPVFIQAKLDGVRCYITKDGAFTRNHNEIKNIEHIKQELKELFERYPEAILDGELYNHELKEDFNKIISLVRKQKPSESDSKDSKALIQFHWYDIYTDELQRERTAYIKLLYQEFFGRKMFTSVGMVRTFEVASEDQITSMHKQYLLDGYEGSILRLNGKYETKRSKNLQKVKDFHDAEATIVEILPSSNIEGAVEKFVMQDENGNCFGCPLGKFTHAQRREIWNNRKDYLGKQGTFEYFQRTKSGSYRHPLFKALRNYE